MAEEYSGSRTMKVLSQEQKRGLNITGKNIGGFYISKFGNEVWLDWIAEIAVYSIDVAGDQIFTSSSK